MPPVSKKVLQDIVPSNRRTILSVPLKRASDRGRMNEVPIRIKHTREEPMEDEVTEEEEIIEREKPKRKDRKTKSSGGKFFLSFIVIFICIAIIGIALSLLYTKGVVTITPITQVLNIEGTLTVKKEAGLDQLKYDVITASAESSKEISASNGPIVQTKAKGTITLFNNYSATSQKIVAGTRILSGKELVYKTTSTVTIPAKKTVAGKVLPGSVNVAVIADQAGAQYNILLKDLTGDFRIMAYKGTDKYSTIYGRTKTEITGGFSGTKKIIAPEVLEKATSELKADLEEKLVKQIKPIIPKDYSFFNNAYTIEYKTLEPSAVVSNSSKITMQGTIYGIIFNNNIFLKTIASKELQSFPTQTYNTKGLQDLKFEIKNIKDFSAKKETTLTFGVKGLVTLTGTFDEAKLKNDLLGINLKDSNAIFRKYSSIASANAIITPFWMRSFPNSAESIIIEYKDK